MIRTRRVGGIRFLWLGPLVLTFCVSRHWRARAALRRARALMLVGQEG